MNVKRAIVTACVAVALAGVLASSAAADLTHNGRFVFRPTINHGDPVNILFHGGQDPDIHLNCDEDKRRSSECVAIHTRVDWKRGAMAGRVCSGSGRLTFRKGSGTASDTQDESLSTSGTCKRQFHIRVWDDVTHGHENGNHNWDVGAIHHENRPWNEGGHDIDWDWESAENVMIEQMGARQESEDRHCTYPDYYPLPGSGPGKIRNFYTNGRISRVSFQHIEQSDGCRGG